MKIINTVATAAFLSLCPLTQAGTLPPSFANHESNASYDVSSDASPSGPYRLTALTDPKDNIPAVSSASASQNVVPRASGAIQSSVNLETATNSTNRALPTRHADSLVTVPLPQAAPAGLMTMVLIATVSLSRRARRLWI